VALPLKLVGHPGVVPLAVATPGAIAPIESATATTTAPRFFRDSVVLAIFHMLKHYVNHVLIVQGENFIS
jgi:hypothetical protein